MVAGCTPRLRFLAYPPSPSWATGLSYCRLPYFRALPRALDLMISILAFLVRAWPLVIDSHLHSSAGSPPGSWPSALPIRRIGHQPPTTTNSHPCQCSCQGGDCPRSLFGAFLYSSWLIGCNLGYCFLKKSLSSPSFTLMLLLLLVSCLPAGPIIYRQSD